MAKIKREALTVTRLINEILVSQLSIPLRQIVNDTTFKKYTGIKRPDLLISEFDFTGDNEDQFIANLVAYAEVKDNCSIDDTDWKDGISQGQIKSKLLGLPYFIVTNCRTSIFYNSTTGKEITLNKNPIREFQTIDIFRLIKNKLAKDNSVVDIQTNVDSISTISEAIFNKKLWELKVVYRGINFKNNVEKIDFTIGFVALEYFEEKTHNEGKIDKTKIYWSDCYNKKAEQLVANIVQYITRLERETNFKEFKELIETVKISISGVSGKNPLISNEDVAQIYDIVNTMKPLHNSGFDLFGAVYEMFANNNEKREFGEFFTRRHYTHAFAKLLLKDELYFSNDRKFNVLDPACGTGGFLTETFKILRNNYTKTGTYNKEAKKFLTKEVVYGIDNREENVLRTKLNMFLVGDGHTNIKFDNTLKRRFQNQSFQYILTNPPYGDGTIKADSSAVSSKRLEIAFLCKIIDLLKVGGKGCIVVPDGILESPTTRLLRKDLMEKCNIDAIVSLPKFAFAPYTKEKTYGLFITKRSHEITKVQKNSIWMYIIDNDGLANSDKRFPTKLRNNRNGWKHDEISGWVSTDGEEMPGLLEHRWMTYDDKKDGGTKWANEKGEAQNLRKGGFLEMKDVLEDKYLTLLPEYYLRPYEPNYISINELNSEIKIVNRLLKNVAP